MSFGSATRENAVTKAYHSITLIAGLEADINRKTRPVDLNVQGGGIFNKNLVVCGNIDVEGLINGDLGGDIITSNIVAANLTEGITIIGNVTIDNDFILSANILHANTITSSVGDDITFEATDMIILNAPAVVVTGNIESDTITVETTVGNVLCANNRVETDKIVPKTGGNVCVTGNLIVTDTLFASNIAGNSPVTFLDNIVVSNIGGQIVFQDGIVIGNATTTADECSIAIGKSTIASGNNSVAVGTSSSATGNITAAFGYGATTATAYRVQLGGASHTSVCTIVAVSTCSDERDKTNIESFSEGLNVVKQLTPRKFNFDRRSLYEDETPDGTHIDSTPRVGFIAQEVNGVQANANVGFLNLVNTDDENVYMINTDHLHPLYVNAFKELDGVITTLTARIAALEANI